jgi:hypothetical protein
MNHFKSGPDHASGRISLVMRGLDPPAGPKPFGAA